MSGRGSGRGQGGQGKGGGFNRRRNNNNKKPEKEKKSLKDYNYYLGSSKQASDFESTTEFIINHVKKTYNHGRDIAEALKTLEPID